MRASAKRHVVVVGGSSGIGAATVRRLNNLGWAVSSLGRRADGDGIYCDVEKPESINLALEKSEAQDGPITDLVYSAGFACMGNVQATSEAAARRCFEVNFWGLDRVVRAAIPRIHSVSHSSLLVVLSIVALIPVKYQAYYGASKAAALRYLDGLRLELAPEHISVFDICPGYIETGFFQRAQWFGMKRQDVKGSGVSADLVARHIERALSGRLTHRVVGWRETVITLAERALPGSYSTWLRLKG